MHLCIQKKDGNFILKIFDCFMNHTINKILFFIFFYEKTYIVKPKTSRYANSEKYIVCLVDLYNSNSEFYTYIYIVVFKIC